ncbi:isopentenyl-diphosphate delta-isomerase [Enterococcus sp. PF1-24]|uniref:type 2 isopentenyl-diphosphate Delta-isomerase n=1 Tax=unclassified Enterococcus TaxID=2608891 RepID=UPI002474C78A|nr:MULTISPECIES: type 2 isopentenyl-diphosphate Delta-isomerase [unclassified Enterococcus]MDH6363949.1 isopentenyl-diphosphate delta-isomerase [Enterococcus sp. PFB1-1]MDH6401050.1 isopentenyl-diphosphate delta-isomerase [Enterococcus sp. PF1-24]
MSNRKDEHLNLANNLYQTQPNAFDDCHFVHHSLNGCSPADVDLSSQLGPWQLATPFYINAMTGGSYETGKINQQLSLIAKETGLLMATGSLSAALKDATLKETFQIVRKENPQGLILANVGAGIPYSQAQQAVEMLQADGLQIHLNLPQELVMPEGDRHFDSWQNNIAEITAKLNVPVMVKEVGFGMSRETILKLADLGVKIIDVSGQGGTSFTAIENSRRSQQEFTYLNDWGQSTVVSLLEAQSLPLAENISFAASGGIRNAFDIFKCLCLGARAVGISGTILHSLMTTGTTATIALIQQWQKELQTLYALVGAKNWQELQQTQLIFSGYTKDWCEARGIDLRGYGLR